jgi:parallel beta-helix repeat protein
MNKKIAVIWVSLAVVLSFIVIIVEIAQVVEAPTIIYVGSGAGNHTTSIQDAIDNFAKTGDTVFVYAGTYLENVVVNKMINLTGEDRNTTIIDGGGGVSVIRIEVDKVNVTGFTVINGNFGIRLFFTSNSTITNNIASNNDMGIYIQDSNGNNIVGNNASSNNNDGIWISRSDRNYITGNIAFLNSWNGIRLGSSNSNNITGNTLSSNDDGIALQNSSNNNIIGNDASSNIGNGIDLNLYSLGNNIINNNILSNPIGIHLRYSNETSILNNNISNNGNGIELFSSYGNNITGNNISNNDYGIVVDSSSSNDIVKNDIFLSNWYGIYLSFSDANNITDNNIINNSIGIYIDRSSNNYLTNNNVTLNDNYGILLFESSYTNITSNYVYLNSNFGVYLDAFSNNNNISSNNFSGNNFGLYISLSSYNNIAHNDFSNNWGNCIYIYTSSYNNVTNNDFLSNQNGITLSISTNNNVINNTAYFGVVRGIYLRISSNNNTIKHNIVSNNLWGITLESSSTNLIYHNNIINNINQAYDDQWDNYWDNGYPSGGNYWSDFDESSEGAYDDYLGTNQNVLGSDGIVDNGTIGGGGKNPYIIDSNSQDNYPLISPIRNLTFLYKGWNLISIPFIQSDTNLGNVLSSIKGSYTAVQWYNASNPSDAWKHNCSLKPHHLNDLNDIDHLMGFWIYITKPNGVLFEYFGNQPTLNQTLTLHPGWNLVGYPSLTNYNRTEGLNNLTFGTHVDAILTYNASTQTWKKLGPSDYFEIGRGYWIHAKTKCEWEVPL